MQNIQIRLANVILCLVVLIGLFPLRANADSTLDLSVPENIQSGSDFSVTVTFQADENIGSVSASLGYSSSDLEFVSSDNAIGSGGIADIEMFPENGSKSCEVVLNFRALRAGTTRLQLTNGSIMLTDGSLADSLLSADADLTIKGGTAPSDSVETVILPSDSSEIAALEPQDTDSSSNSGLENDSSSTPDNSTDSEPAQAVGTARLKKLSISAGELRPAFSPQILEYDVTVPHDTEYISVDAELENEYDTIWYEGSEYLGIGMTPWTITVTSVDGSEQNVYRISVVRPSEDSSSLSDSSSEVTSEITAAPINSVTSSKPKPSSSARVSSAVAEKKTPLREKLMPILIAAVCIIAAAVIALIVRIHFRKKNILK